MAKAVYIVVCNSADPAQEDEFNHWYTDIHARDILAVPEAYPVLAEQLRIPEPGELPVIALEALVLMKLHANRPHDRADVDGLLRTSGLRRLIEDYLGNHAPHLLERMVGLGD